MRDNPPSRSAAIKLMAKEPNLIRRPVAIRVSQIVLGFDEEAYGRLVK
jgi:arsenate reductase-like glutaredoxin family protein